MVRFNEELAFHRLEGPGPDPAHGVIDVACRAFADALYPRYQAGPIVLETRTSPNDSDEAVREGGRGFVWLAAIDAASGPDFWWYSRGPRPTADAFRAPTPGDPLLFGKPASSCLFTSGGSTHWRGMWSSVARAEMQSDALQPWRFERPGRAREVIIDSAVAWCRLVATYPHPTSRGLVPDWPSVAEDHDVVTITASAVASLDCIEHVQSGLVFAPTYWATRTSVWLRWAFDGCSSSGA